MPQPTSPFKRVRREFDRDALKRICEMHETDFPEAFGLTKTLTGFKAYAGDFEEFYAFRDNGSDILAVAHLDTVVKHERRMTGFLDTAAGPVVYSGALDDRLGAYTILELMPRLGINFDILLTTGEEDGNSTAQFFDAPEGKEYRWMIEFDRGGTDVVMYQYEDANLRGLVRDCGARPALGAFSDISYLEHLGIKGLNWGVGYEDYHGPRGHAYLEDYWEMLGYFLRFHAANAETHLPHEKERLGLRYGGGSVSRWGDRFDRDENDPLEDDANWTNEAWDAYCDGGMEAVRDLLEREGMMAVFENPEDAILAEERDADADDASAEETVSEEFGVVNDLVQRQLMPPQADDDSSAA